jgi:hypothetical protein
MKSNYLCSASLRELLMIIFFSFQKFSNVCNVCFECRFWMKLWSFRAATFHRSSNSLFREINHLSFNSLKKGHLRFFKIVWPCIVTILCEWNQQTHLIPVLLVLRTYMFRAAFCPSSGVLSHIILTYQCFNSCIIHLFI